MIKTDVVVYNVKAKIAGGEQDVEVETILDDGLLREGSGCVRRFWIENLGRPMYLGHLGKEEAAALVSAVRSEAARLKKKGEDPAPAQSRWAL